MAFRGLYRAKKLESTAKVFAELHRLTRQKDNEYWFFQAKPHCGLFTDLPSSLKNWKNQFFILRSKILNRFEGIPHSWQYLVPSVLKKIALNRDKDIMVKELKDQAATHKYLCLDAVMAELK